MPVRRRSMAQYALPFARRIAVETPLSIYAATKLADELMSYAYAHLHGLPQTGLRFFTVYGPWGRPDMAYYSFAKAIMAGDPIKLFKSGKMRRDFTYIDDIVAGVVATFTGRLRTNRPCGSKPRQSSQRIGQHACPAAGAGARAPRHCARSAATADRCAGDLRLGGRDRRADRLRSRTPLADGIPRFAAWFKAWNGA